MILGCGFMADGVRRVLGDGSALGVRLRYLEEPRPLGTGGALKFAEELLDERFLMLNGDVLTDIDLTAQLAQHERTGARGTLALVAVDDPSAYGLVPLEDDGSVREFVEKPGPDQIDTNLVNAGAYILERDVLDRMPPGRDERLDRARRVPAARRRAGCTAIRADGYWLDIGTPERYLQATYDILEGNVDTDDRPPAGRRRAAAHGRRDGRGTGAAAGARRPRQAEVGEHAVVGGRTVLGPRRRGRAGRPRRRARSCSTGASDRGPQHDQRLDHRPRRDDRRALPHRRTAS